MGKITGDYTVTSPIPVRKGLTYLLHHKIILLLTVLEGALTEVTLRDLALRQTSFLGWMVGQQHPWVGTSSSTLSW